MELVITLGLLSIGLLALLLYMFQRAGIPGRKGAVPDARARTLGAGSLPLSAPLMEKKVLTLMRGDKARFERTLRARQEQHPRASRAELLEIIHEEYLRDHR